MKDLIINLLKTVERNNIDNLIKWIENTDYFTAPASTRFHGAVNGGLSKHSYNVYQCISSLQQTKEFNNFKFKDDSIIIVSLLHDVCKINFYKESTRNVKNEITGQWEKQPFYIIEDSEPYGHGEKSVMIIERYIKLTDEEKYSIRWHMGGFDESVKGGSYSIGLAYEKYPMALALHLADMMSTYILESK
jgi:hypothetical protein